MATLNKAYNLEQFCDIMKRRNKVWIELICGGYVGIPASSSNEVIALVMNHGSVSPLDIQHLQFTFMLQDAGGEYTTEQRRFDDHEDVDVFITNKK